MQRDKIAQLVLGRIQKDKELLATQFNESDGFCTVDDLLPSKLVELISREFPDKDQLREKKDLREHKHFSQQLNKYHPILEEVQYAFQNPLVVAAISEITGVEGLLADKSLYAAGLSVMGKNEFINPHIDNSHDKDEKKWRVFNLLYYVSKDWDIDNGGNLELWPDGLDKKQVTINSKFNRLVIMATHDTSWHSVSPVCVDRARCCISNYYFSETSPSIVSRFHVTSFRGRPGQRTRDYLLRVDTLLRMSIRKILSKRLTKQDYEYINKSDED